MSNRAALSRAMERGEVYDTDRLLRDLKMRFRAGLIPAAEAANVARSAGAFEAEIREAFSTP